MRIWATGAAGMLGTEVVNALERRGVVVLATDREVDITNTDAVSGYWTRAVRESGGTPVDWVINCAAWTAVDAAEDNEETAMLLNATGPAVLASVAAEHGAAILHVSTDYVFDGQAPEPYRPDSKTEPQSAYGRTKLAGEIAVREANSRHVILRTAWLYGPNGKNFVSTMLRLMNERDEVRVVDDQHGCPTYAPDLATAIARIVATDRYAWGTYHLTGADPSTWYDFARAIYVGARERGLVKSECAVVPTDSRSFGSRAPRPTNSILDCSNIVRDYGIEPVPWSNALDRYLDLLAKEQQ